MIEKIVSGGQTGVDRAALDAALAAGFPCGGWCPAGRRAEDGRLPARYPLSETGSAGYAERTRRNVEESDGTLILAPGGDAERARNGTRLTAQHARRTGKPLMVLDPWHDDAVAVVDWAEAGGIAVLNVAGPRANKAPEIYTAARALVAAVIDLAVKNR